MESNYKSQSKAIKSIINHAESGNLLAQYQLYEIYSKGLYAEKDLTLAENYLNEMAATLKGRSFHLKTIHLANFRRFADLKFNLEKKLTVIIGDNGVGKTTIADAIAKTLTWFNGSVERGMNGSPIGETDINIGNCDYAAILTTFELDNKNLLDVSIGRTKSGIDARSPTNVVDIKRLAAIYRHIINDQNIMLPLHAYYSVDRSSFNFQFSNSDETIDDIRINRFSALRYALDGSRSFKNFSTQYIELANLADSELNPPEVDDLHKQVRLIENTIKSIYGKNQPSEKNEFISALRAKAEELASKSNSYITGKYKKHLNSVNSAIETLVPDIKNIRISRDTGKTRILVDNFGVEVNIAHLSSGQKALVALAGDIAQRLVTLNPDAENPLRGPGIIVIDEIELHLHPRWQQEILLRLQETFPNIQFIVTTHSPQILSTVDKSCIRMITSDNENHLLVETPKFQTKGVASADVLSRIMNINPVPEHIPEAGWVDSFHKALTENNNENRDHYLNLIRSHFGEGHPVVLDCESQIRILAMKEKWSNNK